MKRLAIVGGLVVVGLAVGVYRAKLGAEETEYRIEKLEKQIETVRHDISVLRAEEAYLSRPERIGPLARDRLGLQPAAPSQFSAGETLRARVGEERIVRPEPDTAAPGSRQTPAVSSESGAETQ